MKREVRVLPEAEEELAAAAEWYEERRPGLGIQFVATVDAAVDRVVEAPLVCPIWLEGFPYRKLVMQRFPYIVLFRIVGGDVEIVAFAHAKRAPGYWVERSR
jgi:plasmid stabilization system protein ParE